MSGGHSHRSDCRGDLRRGKRSSPAGGAGGKGTLPPVGAGDRRPASRSAGLQLGLPTPPQDPDVGVPGFQPGTGDAAEGRPAARAVARHSAPPRAESGVQDGARRHLRQGAIGHGAVGGVRGPGAVLRRLYRVADGGGEERQSGTGAAPLRGAHQGDARRPVAGDLRADLSGGPGRAVRRRRQHDRLQGRAGVRGVLPVQYGEGAELPASTRIVVAISDDAGRASGR